MKPEHSRRLSFGLIVALLLSAVVTQLLVHHEVRRLRDAINLERKLFVQVLEAEWKDAFNVTHRVRTSRMGPSEDLAEWVERHRVVVEALKAIYPPV